jgi:hypothetical protein
MCQIVTASQRDEMQLAILGAACARALNGATLWTAVQWADSSNGIDQKGSFQFE